MRRILCVTAHPDDEVASFGGTVQLYCTRGVEFRLICLTGGEAARNRGGAADNAALIAMRKLELAASCELLGIAWHEVWDLPDAHLPEVPFHAIAGRLVREIRSWRPDLMVTFGPEGSATGHPDHGMAGMLATAAFHWAGQARYFPDSGQPIHETQRLFYSTAAFQPPQFPKVWLPAPQVEINAEPFLERKLEAFACHTSQAPLLDRVQAFMRATGGRELFHLGAGAPGLPEIGFGRDLFEGLAS